MYRKIQYTIETRVRDIYYKKSTRNGDRRSFREDRRYSVPGTSYILFPKMIMMCQNKHRTMLLLKKTSWQRRTQNLRRILLQLQKTKKVTLVCGRMHGNIHKIIFKRECCIVTELDLSFQYVSTVGRR